MGEDHGGISWISRYVFRRAACSKQHLTTVNLGGIYTEFERILQCKLKDSSIQ